MFTEKQVTGTDAGSAVPEGCRMARLDEICRAWREDPKFLKRMCELPTAVWIDLVGLDSYGPHRIDDKGIHRRITLGDSRQIGLRERSWHYPGSSRVALEGEHVNGLKSMGRLYVVANAKPNEVACVAYVKIEQAKPGIMDILRVSDRTPSKKPV
jgi:hypothetical protein